jgi:uncharacterized membrane protein
MIGLTTLGIFHTVVSLIALACGVAALVRSREISPRDRLGQIYLVGTFISAATGLGIFQHGGFGPPHMLALMTLAALVIGTVAAMTAVFGRASRYLQAIAYSTTIFFHLIPGITETSTRLPRGAPLVASAEAPELRVVALILLIALVIGLTFQLRWLRRTQSAA